ncbi:hypothetical protein BGZ58_007933 [Dissophora ornata]|nr:hypothetical protein BGZ58_007933 [Dissophora ornata]
MASPQQQSLNPQCLAEQRLRSSFAQHQEYQQQMRKRLSDADHPLHLPSPELAQRHQQQLGLQLEYYRQLQIMHCQRVRDIELLHLQQQQLQQQQPQPVQVVKRFQLAQRMLQMQQIYHAQQIQRIQYLQKLNHLQRQNELEQTPPVEAQAIDSVSEEVIAKLEIDPNTIHIPVRAASRPRLDMQEILGTQGSALPHPSTSGRSRVRELARIKLPSPDQIRTLRHQRLKHQARLRQAAAAKSKAASHARQQPCTTDKIDSHGCDMSLQPTCSEFNTTPTSSKLGTVEEVQLTKQVQATVWTSSTTTVVPRSLADLQYKRQLRHSMALQQHMIQDHTHRYRIFQAFCLLQRAREAQALDELQTQKRRHLQTLAWVEALRQSKELEIPQ